MFVEWSSQVLQMFVPAVWNQRCEQKSVCLTFDDGPTPEVTPKVLDILDRYGVKATFFCVGNNVQNHPDLFDEVRRRGHRVGNHTMQHLKGFEVGKERYLQDVEAANELIESDLFRPPYGRIRLSQFLALRKKYRIVMWDVITRDYNPKVSPDKCMAIVRRFVRDGSIIVFHDSKKAEKNVLAALPQAIEWLIAEGYSFRLIEGKR